MGNTYKLLKDLPMYKAGELFYISSKGNLIHTESKELVYSKGFLAKAPETLKDWFEEIPETPKTIWDLKSGDLYYRLMGNGSVIRDVWLGSSEDRRYQENGNCFLTYEDAEKELARRKAEVILRKDTKGFKPNWEDETELEFTVSYNHDSHCLVSRQLGFYNVGQITFRNTEEAEASMRNHRKEWLTYLGVEE